MRLFFLVFFSLYSLMHAFVWFRVRILLPAGGPWQKLSIVFFGLMVLAPAAVRFLERSGHEPAARVTAYIGYTWMGFVFLAFCAFVVLSLGEGLGQLISRHTFIPNPLQTGKTATAVALAVVALVCVHGFFEARDVRTEQILVETYKLPPGIDRIRIAQISDVHLGLIVRAYRWNQILERVRIQNPDLLVCTGDLVDGDYGGEDGVGNHIAQIQPRYGRFAVTGNHEAYAGLDHSLSTLERFGFRVLRGEAQTVQGLFNVVGVNDPALGGSDEQELAALSKVQNGLFTLLLKHRPHVTEETRARFDLQLSGHTHRGQIFPFNFVTAWAYPMQNGLYTLKAGVMLYTSRGSGTWGPPMRVLSPPEVTIIDVVRAEGS
ncbi:MAG: metallophosphoesterase [Syntrophobacteraceae bacterium]